MSLRNAILGFLNYQPMSGYELNGYFKESVGFFWTADQSQIYRTLSDLEADELVKSKVVPQAGKPDRREYRILPKGRKVFDAWLKQPLAPDVLREPFLLKLFLAQPLGADGVQALLAEKLALAESSLAALVGLKKFLIEQYGKPRDLDSNLKFATLEYGIAFYQMEVDWVRETLKQVK